MPDRKFKVVINHEEQYRVVPERRAGPRIRDTGKGGTLEEMISELRAIFRAANPDLDETTLEQHVQDAVEQDEGGNPGAEEHLPR